MERDKALAIGLLTNELITNAVKHAFPNGRDGLSKFGFAEPHGLAADRRGRWHWNAGNQTQNRFGHRLDKAIRPPGRRNADLRGRSWNQGPSRPARLGGFHRTGNRRRYPWIAGTKSPPQSRASGGRAQTRSDFLILSPSKDGGCRHLSSRPRLRRAQHEALSRAHRSFAATGWSVSSVAPRYSSLRFHQSPARCGRAAHDRAVVHARSPSRPAHRSIRCDRFRHPASRRRSCPDGHAQRWRVGAASRRGLLDQFRQIRPLDRIAAATVLLFCHSALLLFVDRHIEVETEIPAKDDARELQPRRFL